MKLVVLPIVLLLPSLHPWLADAQLCPIQQTPSDALGPFYLENSPSERLIGEELKLMEPSNRLEVFGRVLSASNCSLGLANVAVEIWYAGEPDEEGNLYRDDESRGQVVTNECGEYNFTQTFPLKYPGRPLHTHFRLSRGGEEFIVTQLYFVGEGEGFVTDGSQPLQAMQVETIVDGSRRVEFDMFVNREGDAGCNLASPPVNSPVEEQPQEPNPVQEPSPAQETVNELSPVVEPAQEPANEPTPVAEPSPAADPAPEPTNEPSTVEEVPRGATPTTSLVDETSRGALRVASIALPLSVLIVSMW